ncbi:MAG TPA: xanthine dehydrogenase family protein subunit M [Ktedonobacterales bacterium]
MRAFEHTTATTPQEALSLLGKPSGQAQIIAGGTDLLTLMKEGLAAPAQLIDIKPLRELRYLRFDGNGALHLGALTTLADLERDGEVAARLPLLREAVRDAASPQLRAMATVGGNLVQENRCWYYRGPYECWLKGGEECFARGGRDRYHAIHLHGPCVAVHPSDLVPALVALDATVSITGPSGTRAQPVAALYAPPTPDRRSLHTLQAGDLITEVQVPMQPQGARGVYLKAMDRAAWAFALVSAAAQVAIRDGRVERAALVLGGVANGPWRVAAADQLRGQELTAERAAAVAAAAVEGATPLPHNAFKVPLARELARRALLSAAGMPL